ncbi:UDP-4-amino-4-deoxy-L-arabinose--oxoglutarate aminotransferase [Streptomyces tendae]
MLRAAGVGVGDEVVVPAFGNVEVAEAVSLVGALPVFADIDPATYCLDASLVEAALTPRTAAIVVVHRFGRPADMGALHRIGQRHGLLVLERAESEAPYDEIARRRQRAAYLDGKLRGVRTPHDGGDGHTYQQYVVRVPGNGRPDRRRVRPRGAGEGRRVPGAGEDARAPDAWIQAVCVPAGDGAGRRRDARAAGRSRR